MPMPAPALVECCGRVRQSRFCPECGKNIADSPLLDLLTYLRTTGKKLRSKAENWHVMEEIFAGKEDEANATARKATGENLDAAADKWTAWADVLADLIERDRSAKAD